MKWLRSIAFVAIYGGAASPAFAQGSDIYGKGMTVNLGDDKEATRYIRFITWVQTWARFQESNPGSAFSNQDPVDTQSDTATGGDVLIRRARFLTYSQLTKDVLVMFHIGINNQNFTDFRVEDFNAEPFVHDAWAEYTWFRSPALTLSTGAGLHYWNGPIRMSSASTLNFLTIDAPISNWPVIEVRDQFARQLGLYFKGKAFNNLVDFRFAINRPFIRGTPPSPSFDVAQFNNSSNTWGTQGYFNLQLWDKEGNLLPYFVGTYLGKKRVLNFGFGWYHEKDATISGTTDGGTVTHDINMLGADVFFDSPLGFGSLTFYGAYYYADFGPNLVRFIGISNLAEGAPGDATALGDASGPRIGPGQNSFATTGTGNLILTEFGYAIPLGILTSEDQIQPYFRAQVGFFDGLEDTAPVLETGFNYFLHGHHAKFTLHYRARPVHRNEAVVTDPEASATFGDEGFGTLDGFVNEVIAQVQVWL